jgi:hypothetical protein
LKVKQIGLPEAENGWINRKSMFIGLRKYGNFYLKEEYDIYVVDREFNWTFVKTHETEWCGPYFSRREKKIKVISFVIFILNTSIKF